MMSPDTLAFGNVTKGKGGKVSTKVTFTSDPELGGQEGEQHRRVRASGVQTRLAQRHRRDL